MSVTPNTAQSLAGKKLLEALQADLRSIASEARKKHPPLKEAAEAGILKLKNASTKHSDLRLALLSESAEIIEPFFMACDTKTPKMVQIGLTAIHRMITFEAVSVTAAINLVNCLWNLMESSIEEVRLLQTMTLLVSTNEVLQGTSLAKGISLCFRLHFTKNSSTSNAASATVRQIYNVVFERVVRAIQAEVSSSNASSSESTKVVSDSLNNDDLKQAFIAGIPPKSLSTCPSAVDAYMLFQDVIQLVSADQPFWLTGLTEMTRTFGLELVETILSSYPEVFFRHQELAFLLRERLSPLIIQLFAPSTAHVKKLPTSNDDQSPTSVTGSPDKSFYPISIRLLRIVSVLLQKFHTLLITESEIFMSILIKMLAPDRPLWQRAAGLEVVHRLCTHPNLLKSLCCFYDMKPQSSKIFRDLISALGVFVQNCFLPQSTGGILSSIMGTQSSTTPSSSSTGNNSGNTNIPQSNPNEVPHFSLGPVSLPLLFILRPGQMRTQLLDQLDRTEVPIIPEGYGITTGYFCTLDVVRSLIKLVDGTSYNAFEGEIVQLLNSSGNKGAASSMTSKSKNKKERLKDYDDETRDINGSLLTASWPGLLSSLSVFLETSSDESVTCCVLKMIETLSGLYGIYGLTEARHAFVTTICKSTLPSGYQLPTLSLAFLQSDKTHTRGHRRTPSDISSCSESSVQTILSNNFSVLQQQFQATSNSHSGLMATESSDPRLKVVVMGSSLAPSTHSLPSSSSQLVMLSSHNILCTKSLLTIATNHGCVLQESWFQVLLSLQHVTWILGLRPSTGGSLKTTRTGMEGVTTASSFPDMPSLTMMISRLFSSTIEFDEQGLEHFMESLIRLSLSACDSSTNVREPSIFAVAKLMEVGLINLSRLDLFWKNLSNHLIEVCCHQSSKFREWAADALTTLIVAAINLKKEEESKNCLTKSQFEYLAALQDLSDINYSDVRQKQLNVCLQLIQSTGDSLNDGWPQILSVIGAANDTGSEALIRLSFQCLQLVISDFLSSVPSVCLVMVIDTAAKFGSQVHELNVSLTAIGCLWNATDFLHQNRDKIRSDLEQQIPSPRKEPASELPAFECLWMNLFTKLGFLCSDSRPPIRKSASQTLFAALTTYGETLHTSIWQSILWKVLFPLLERVHTNMTQASDEKIVDASKSMGVTGVGSSANFLLHHSRNTEYKQWAETQVLTLSGVCLVISSRRDTLTTSVAEFAECWSLVLRHIHSAATSKNSEVSEAALKCFHELLTPSKKTVSESLWLDAWQTWTRIGDDVLSDDSNWTSSIPSQSFLTSYLRLFHQLMHPLKASFTVEHFETLSLILHRLIAVPVDSTTQAYLMTVTSSALDKASQMSVACSISPLPLTPLQEVVVSVIETICNDWVTSCTHPSTTSRNPRIVCHIERNDLFSPAFDLLLTIFSFCCRHSSHPIMSTAISSSKSNPEWSGVTYVPLGERSLRLAISLYETFATEQIVLENQIFPKILRTLRTPLALKHSCTSQFLWKMAVLSLVRVVKIGLPISRQQPSFFTNIWADLAGCLEDFLFSPSQSAHVQSLEEQQRDEEFDVRIVELIRDVILPFSSEMPEVFVLQVVSILNRGSIHSQTTTSPIDMESNRKLREEFARSCFDTLLRFSFTSSPSNNKGPVGTDTNLFISNRRGSSVSVTSSSSTNASGNNSGNGTFSAEINGLAVEASAGLVFTGGLVNKLAVTSLLTRFRQVIEKYIQDERLSGKCPLARHRVAEIAFVLKALATLISSLKRAPSDAVEEQVWDHLIDLYPHLVLCTSSAFPQVNRSLQEVLLEFRYLLRPPMPTSSSLPSEDPSSEKISQQAEPLVSTQRYHSR